MDKDKRITELETEIERMEKIIESDPDSLADRLNDCQRERDIYIEGWAERGEEVERLKAVVDAARVFRSWSSHAEFNRTKLRGAFAVLDAEEAKKRG